MLRDKALERNTLIILAIFILEDPRDLMIQKISKNSKKGFKIQTTINTSWEFQTQL